jgi:dTDP-glucose 4,6-dehydratase
MKLVVITGCLGFIGSYVTRAALGLGWKVYGIDKGTYAANMHLLPEFKQNPNFTFAQEDIAELKALPDCDYVINTAAETHVGNSIIDSDDFLHTNVNGVKNLLELIRHKPDNVCEPPIFFHFSTDEVYGDISTGAHRETDTLAPSNPYSASKAAADMLVKAWARTYDIKYVILRPTNNYGIDQHVEKLVPLCVKLLQRNKLLRLHDRGTPVRNWLHAADTAAAVIKIIESGKVNEIYNVAGDFEQKNIDTVKKILECYYRCETEWERYIDLAHRRPGQDIRYCLDDTKLRTLGWSPIKIFDDEIQSIVDYYKNNFYW